MGVGTSIFLIALGAIFRFAVKDPTVFGIRLEVVGLILMIVGVIGLVASLIMASAWWANRRGETVVVRDRDVP